MTLTRTFPHPVSGLYTCEICQKEVSDIDVVTYILQMSNPGKNGILGSFKCGAEQHFGCCEEHAWEAVVACRTEHILPAHDQLHQAAEANPQIMAKLAQMRASQNTRPVWKLINPPDAPPSTGSTPAASTTNTDPTAA